MEKRIYPNIPTAPPEEDRGSHFNSYSARSKFEDLKKRRNIWRRNVKIILKS